jgi:hypothetical protein
MSFSKGTCGEVLVLPPAGEAIWWWDALVLTYPTALKGHSALFRDEPEFLHLTLLHARAVGGLAPNHKQKLLEAASELAIRLGETRWVWSRAESCCCSGSVSAHLLLADRQAAVWLEQFRNKHSLDGRLYPFLTAGAESPVREVVVQNHPGHAHMSLHRVRASPGAPLATAPYEHRLFVEARSRAANPSRFAEELVWIKPVIFSGVAPFQRRPGPLRERDSPADNAGLQRYTELESLEEWESPLSGEPPYDLWYSQ